MASFSEKLNAYLKKRMAALPEIVPAGNDLICPQDPQNVRLTAVLWSDLHFSGFYAPERAMHCRTAMRDLSQAASPVDVLLITGDLAENGKQAEKEYLAEQLNLLPTVRNILPVSGNHDSRLRHIAHSEQKFARFCGMVNPRIRTEKLYYSFDVNGYTFLVLGTTKTMFEACAFDEEEIEWMCRELARATAQGRPVFVALHQPLRRTHNLPRSWDYPGDERGAVGAQSDRIRGILNEYPNVFLLSGHLHRGFSINTYEEVGRIHSVNVPSTGVWNKDSDYGNAGLGFLMEVYDDCVVFRPRDFIAGGFIPEYVKKYPLEAE